MLKRSLLIAVGLVLVYNACLCVPAFRRLFSVQGQWQQNIITAQRYMLEDRTPEVVIVGSSLSAAMPLRVLNPDICSLAFSGGSIFTGLDIIEAKPKLPRVVIIEENVLYKGSDPHLLDNVLRPGFCAVRSKFPALQEQWQPMNVMAGKLCQYEIEKLFALKNRLLGIAPKNELSSESPVEGGSDLFNRMLAIAHEAHSVPPPVEALDQQSELLRAHVERLRSRGVECVFFEMPVDASLTDSPRCSAVRAKALAMFPPSQYRWITPEKDRKYITSDGQHLRGAEAEGFARFLRSRLSQIGVLQSKPLQQNAKL